MHYTESKVSQQITDNNRGIKSSSPVLDIIGVMLHIYMYDPNMVIIVPKGDLVHDDAL